MNKKADAWKQFQNEMKDKRSSKKKRTLLHFLLVFLLAGYFGFNGAFFCVAVSESIIQRSSHRRCSVKKGVLKVGFLGKHLCWSLFLINLQACRLATLLRRDANTDVCFPVKFEKFLRTPI